MREWSEGSRRVTAAAFALLALCLIVIVLLVWTLRRPVGESGRASLRDGTIPAELGLPFKHGPKERRQLKDLSSLAAVPGAGGIPTRLRERDEPVQVQPGEGPVSVSGPGGVTWPDRYPSARIDYITTAADGDPAATPVESAPDRPPPGRDVGSSSTGPSRARPGADDPNAAFDPPGQYR